LAKTDSIQLVVEKDRFALALLRYIHENPGEGGSSGEGSGVSVVVEAG